jgi:hypothetical protein
MALPPGCSFPGARDSSPLSPSPLPAWQPRRHTLSAPPPPAGLGPHAHSVGDAGAGALLAGAFPGAPFAGPHRDERLCGAAAAAGAGARGRRSRLMPLAQAAGGVAAGPLHLPDLPEPQPQVQAQDHDTDGFGPPAALPGQLEGADDDSDDGSTGARPKKRPAARLLTRPPGSGCVECGATSTPVWRTGPRGPKTLCNRCGVRYSKMARRNK